jgi:hypothetical protein
VRPRALSDIEPRFVFGACGKRGETPRSIADFIADHARPEPNALMRERAGCALPT